MTPEKRRRKQTAAKRARRITLGLRRGKTNPKVRRELTEMSIIADMEARATGPLENYDHRTD